MYFLTIPFEGVIIDRYNSINNSHIEIEKANKQMPDSKSPTLYMDLLRQSEDFCEIYDLVTAEDLILSAGDSYKRRVRRKLKGDWDTNITLLNIKDAAYFEEVILDEKTKEAIYYAISRPRLMEFPVYFVKMHHKPQEAIADLTAEFISIEKLNKFFKNSSLEKIEHFKCQQRCDPTLLTLLEASEEYCKKNKLSTVNDLKDLVSKFEKNKKLSELSESDRAHLIEVMQKAAYYRTVQSKTVLRKTPKTVKEPQYREEHYALAFEKHRVPSVLAITARDDTDELIVEHYNILGLNEFLGEVILTTHLRHFKCVRDI